MLVNSKTFRDQVHIPKLPQNTDELIHLSAFKMHKASIIGDDLCFSNPNDFEEVLEAGFFLLKIPQALDLYSTDQFTANFFREKDGGSDDAYKGYKQVTIPGDYQGYFDRPNDQWENFYIEKNNWNTFLPLDVIKAGSQMSALGIMILRAVLKKLEIPISDWERVTGGLSTNNGHQMLAFNHFRSEKALRGTKLHRDSGWVTVLRSTEPGLVGFINNQVYAINPEPGFFIINFGSSFEVLTAQMQTPVRANIHGVVRTLEKPDRDHGRTSYVIFLDSDLSTNIYQYQNGSPVALQSMKEFAIQEVSRTYDDGTYL